MRKVKAQRRHAVVRAAERYGLQLTRDDQVAIVRDIQSGRGTLVAKQSNRVSIWDVEIWRSTSLPADPPYVRDMDGETKTLVLARVVYDRERHQIASFLPR